MDLRWRVALLGDLRLEPAGDSAGAAREMGSAAPPAISTTFRTQKTGSLLAYLAYFRDRTHPREVLVELLWPEDEPETGRHKLSVALSSLRQQLEPPGVPDEAVLVTGRTAVRLKPAAVTTDVAEFEAALQ